MNQKNRITGVRDSKMLTEKEREILFDRITNWATAWSVGHASNDECDELGMSEAQRLAARRALAELRLKPDRALLDGNWDFVGGKISQSSKKEFGPSSFTKVKNSKLFKGKNIPKKFNVWMSHSDKVVKLPRNFEVIGSSSNSEISAFSYEKLNIFGYQVMLKQYQLAEY